MFKFLKNRKLLNNASDSLFILMNQYARNPLFFGDEKIIDDPDGRFEAVALFATAVFIGLSGRGELEKEISQTLFNKVFKSFDSALRELGVSDIKVGDRIKKMAESFYGRQKSYIESHGSSDDGELAQKVMLNVLGQEGAANEFANILSQNFRELVSKVKAIQFP